MIRIKYDAKNSNDYVMINFYSCKLFKFFTVAALKVSHFKSFSNFDEFIYLKWRIFLNKWAQSVLPFRQKNLEKDKQSRYIDGTHTTCGIENQPFKWDGPVYSTLHNECVSCLWDWLRSYLEPNRPLHILQS